MSIVVPMMGDRFKVMRSDKKRLISDEDPDGGGGGVAAGAGAGYGATGIEIGRATKKAKVSCQN